MEYLARIIIGLLSLISADVAEVVGLIGGLLLIFGLVNAFFGYKIFKTILSVIGFIVGAVIGAVLFFYTGGGNVGGDAMIGCIVIGGLICSFIAVKLYMVGVFLNISLMGTLIFLMLTQEAQSSLVLGIICGVVGTFIQKYFIIASTAFSGGALAATGILLMNLSNGKDSNTQAVGVMIGVCGLCFQIWLEKRKPGKTGNKDQEGSADFISEFIENIKSKLNDIDPDNAKFAAKKALLAAPVLVGVVAGNLFNSYLTGFGVIAVLYVLVMLQFVKKRKADILPGEFGPKSEWEEWINGEVLDDNGFIMLTPIPVSVFIYLLFDALWNSAAGLVIALLGTVASYYIFIKALPDPGTQSARPSFSSMSADSNLNAPRYDTAAIQTEDIWRCPSCGAVITKGDAFCSECGASVQTMELLEELIFCGECGAQLPIGAQFCGKCGTAVYD
jgi:ribosomal protein L40E